LRASSRAPDATASAERTPVGVESAEREDFPPKVIRSNSIGL